MIPNDKPRPEMLGSRDPLRIAKETASPGNPPRKHAPSFFFGISGAWRSSILIGFCVVVLAIRYSDLYHLGSQRFSTLKSVRENVVWASFQIDRECFRLIRAVHAALHQEPGGDRESIDELVEILVSSRYTLATLNFPPEFKQQPGYIELSKTVTTGIDQIDAARKPWPETGLPAKPELERFLGYCDSLLTNSMRFSSIGNSIQDEIKQNTRIHINRLLFRMTLEDVILWIPIAGMSILLGVQVNKDKKSQKELLEVNEQCRQAAADAQMANQAKSAFLATMSHEIRTPLNGIIGGVDLLYAAGVQPRQQAHLETIRECGTSLMEVINDVLDFARLESSSLQLEKRVVELNLVVESVIEIVSPKARGKNIGLVAVYPKANMIGDEARIRQVLLNLCGNAVKFTEQGDVAIQVSRDHDASERQWVRIEIRDTGIGIGAADLKHLFQDFKQVDSTINRRFGGTGLGLAISRRLVEAMGGTIGVESTLGSGSCFWVMLPTERQNMGQDTEVHWPTREMALFAATTMATTVITEGLELHHLTVRVGMGNEPPDAYKLVDVRRADLLEENLGRWKNVVVFGNGASRYANLVKYVVDGPLTIKTLKRTFLSGRAAIQQPVLVPQPHATYDGTVLVVEDNPVNQGIVVCLLELMGVKVVVAENGKTGLQKASGGAIDLILMDMQMPVMDGLESTRSIRMLPAPLSTVPIIALTANAFDSDRSACLNAGMNGFMTKPINREKLESVLRDWLSKAKPLGGKSPTPPLKQPKSGSLTATEAPVDVAYRDRMASEVGIEMLVRLTSLFWSDLEKAMENLRGFDRQGEIPSIRRALHTLQGSSATVGFTRIANACQQAKELQESRNITDLTAVDEAIQQTRDYLKQSSPS